MHFASFCAISQQLLFYFVHVRRRTNFSIASKCRLHLFTSLFDAREQRRHQNVGQSSAALSLQLRELNHSISEWMRREKVGGSNRGGDNFGKVYVIKWRWREIKIFVNCKFMKEIEAVRNLPGSILWSLMEKKRCGFCDGFCNTLPVFKVFEVKQKLAFMQFLNT